VQTGASASRKPWPGRGVRDAGDKGEGGLPEGVGCRLRVAQVTARHRAVAQHDQDVGSMLRHGVVTEAEDFGYGFPEPAAVLQHGLMDRGSVCPDTRLRR
jgi:hypothetical protein